MEAEVYHLLKTHPCTQGVEEDAVREIADHAAIGRYDADAVIHRIQDPFTTVYLVVQGRVRFTVLDLHGGTLAERICSQGQMFGAIGAALAEPTPMLCVSHGPSVLLQFDYETALKLTLAHPEFRGNVARLSAASVHEIVFGDRLHTPPRLVAFYHETAASRTLTVRLIRRLQSLGENPLLVTDDPDNLDLHGVRLHRLEESERADSADAILRVARENSSKERVFIDLRAGTERIQLTEMLLACNMAMWCVSPDQWQSAVSRFQSIAGVWPAVREKVSLVWLLDAEHESAPLTYK